MRTRYKAFFFMPLMMGLFANGSVVQAHDGYGAREPSQAKQYNPWRSAPNTGWGTQPQQRRSTIAHPAPPAPRYRAPMSPIHARQFEYKNFLQQVKPYYSNNGTPWWSDPVAVPYGPWSQGAFR